MRRLVWKPEKNDWLKLERGISFDEVELQISRGNLITVLANKNYPKQVILVVLIDEYYIAVPANVETNTVFLRTAYYSRKLTKRLGKKDEK